MANIKWNPHVKLILADVDETIADVYMPADHELIGSLNKILESGVKLFLISGGGLNSICDRVALKIKNNLRSNILISHCSGAEVWGFDTNGNLMQKPFYSLYQDEITESQRKIWRLLINKIIKKFDLKIFPTMPVKEFIKMSKADPLSIMYDDRGPQITFEVVNGYDLKEEEVEKLRFNVPISHGFYDIRIPILKIADKLFEDNKIPINSRIEGVFAINFAIKGASKETSIRKILEDENKLSYFNLNIFDIKNPDNVEIWGDKFSELRSRHDSLMSRSVNPKCRSIDFREENQSELPDGYNIVIWNGNKYLHHGLLEYLQTI
jgi:hypothetical protein